MRLLSKKRLAHLLILLFVTESAVVAPFVLLASPITDCGRDCCVIEPSDAGSCCAVKNADSGTPEQSGPQQKEKPCCDPESCPCSVDKCLIVVMGPVPSAEEHAVLLTAGRVEVAEEQRVLSDWTGSLLRPPIV